MASTSRDHATAYARRHRFDVGDALQFDEEAPYVSALEYVLGALAADLVMGLRRSARRERVELDQIEAVVKGSVDNPLAYLRVVGEEGHAGLVRATVKVYTSSTEPTERVALLWKDVLAHSPLVRTLAPSVELALEHEVVI